MVGVANSSSVRSKLQRPFTLHSCILFVGSTVTEEDVVSGAVGNFDPLTSRKGVWGRTLR